MKDIRLDFKLDRDAPPEYLERWLSFKKLCEDGQPSNIHITQMWLSKCNLPSNKTLPILDRCEGGIGGNNNVTDKQIRYDISFSIENAISDHYLMSFRVESSTDEKDLWTFKELSDLIIAFQWVANHHVKEECVIGRIAIYPADDDDLSAGNTNNPEVKDIVFC